MPPSAEGTFPSTGFTVTDDLYLDVHASPGTAGEIDPDVGLSKSGGAYGKDMVFAVCNQGGGTGYSVTFGHSSPGDCSGSAVITSSGWYRFVWVFSNVSGKVYLTQASSPKTAGPPSATAARSRSSSRVTPPSSRPAPSAASTTPGSPRCRWPGCRWVTSPSSKASTTAGTFPVELTRYRARLPPE